MAVHLTRIYTCTCDDGTTGLGDFSRISKTDPRFRRRRCRPGECALGVALALASLLQAVSDAGAGGKRTVRRGGRPVHAIITDRVSPLRIDGEDDDPTGGWCDEFNAARPALTLFIPPVGTPARRCGHAGWPPGGPSGAPGHCGHDEERNKPLTSRYLNRFPTCRSSVPGRNPDCDVLWKPGG